MGSDHPGWPLTITVWFFVTLPFWHPGFIRLRRQVREADRQKEIGPSWSEDEPMMECFMDTDDGLDPYYEEDI